MKLAGKLEPLEEEEAHGNESSLGTNAVVDQNFGNPVE
jgi:hypothetical protein